MLLNCKVTDKLWDQQFCLVQCDGIIIIDAGANDGQSVERYRRRWPDALVHCFEPDPRAFGVLKSRWGDVKDVNLHQVALGAAPGKTQFNLGSASYVSSILPRINGYFGNLPTVSSEEVDVTTLDAFLEKERIPYVNILKMDLQGFELEALKGATRALKEEMFDLIFTEVWFEPAYENTPPYWKIPQLLADFKYKTWAIEIEEYPLNDEGRWGNIIFVSNRYAKVLNYGF